MGVVVVQRMDQCPIGDHRIAQGQVLGTSDHSVATDTEAAQGAQRRIGERIAADRQGVADRIQDVQLCFGAHVGGQRVRLNPVGRPGKGLGNVGGHRGIMTGPAPSRNVRPDKAPG